MDIQLTPIKAGDLVQTGSFVDGSVIIIAGILFELNSEKRTLQKITSNRRIEINYDWGIFYGNKRV